MTASELIALFQTMYREGWKYVPGGASRGPADCSGAFLYAFRQGGLDMDIHGSNWMARFEVEALFPAAEARPGWAVFKARQPGQGKYALPARYRKGGARFTGDLLDYYHVGLADADPAYVLNAQGEKAGFTRRPLAGGWAFAGPLRQIDYTGGNMTKTVCTPDGGTLWLRREPGGEKLARIPCGQTVTVTAEEGGWSAVAWNGKNGWCDSSFLREEDVTLTLPRSAAEALKAALSGAIAP